MPRIFPQSAEHDWILLLKEEINAENARFTTTIQPAIKSSSALEFPTLHDRLELNAEKKLLIHQKLKMKSSWVRFRDPQDNFN